MAPLCYAAKFDPFLSLDCARVEGIGAQSKKGIKFCNLATLMRSSSPDWSVGWRKKSYPSNRNMHAELTGVTD